MHQLLRPPHKDNLLAGRRKWPYWWQRRSTAKGRSRPANENRIEYDGPRIRLSGATLVLALVVVGLLAVAAVFWFVVKLAEFWKAW